MTELDPRLRAALRALPGAPPRPGFVDRVVARAGAAATDRAVPARPEYRFLRPAWASAVAATLVLVLGAGGVAVSRHVAREQRRADLRRESEALRRELSALRAEASREEPALYLGGSEQVDVVLDLDALPVAAAAPIAHHSTHPASRQEEP
jgi:hypothetical protein